MVVNGKDDSPIEGATITFDSDGTSQTEQTNENGNHCENHCKAFEADKTFEIKADKFCDATITMDKVLEGRKDYKWTFLHPKTG